VNHRGVRGGPRTRSRFLIPKAPGIQHLCEAQAVRRQPSSVPNVRLPSLASTGRFWWFTWNSPHLLVHALPPTGHCANEVDDTPWGLCPHSGSFLWRCSTAGRPLAWVGRAGSPRSPRRARTTGRPIAPKKRSLQTGPKNDTRNIHKERQQLYRQRSPQGSLSARMRSTRACNQVRTSAAYRLTRAVPSPQCTR